MLFCVSFLFQFLVAGVNGSHPGHVIARLATRELLLRGGSASYVIVGSILFTIFGAFYYWFPKAVGKMCSRNPRETALLAISHWISSHIRVSCTFLESSACLGGSIHMSPGLGWDIWNLIVTFGVAFQGVGDPCLRLCQSDFWSYFRGEAASNDPWDTWTLEWSTSSPPPAYNYAVIPRVRSRRPLWDLKHPEDPDWR